MVAPREWRSPTRPLPRRQNLRGRRGRRSEGGLPRDHRPCTIRRPPRRSGRRRTGSCRPHERQGPARHRARLLRMPQRHAKSPSSSAATISTVGRRSTGLRRRSSSRRRPQRPTITGILTNSTRRRNTDSNELGAAQAGHERRVPKLEAVKATEGRASQVPRLFGKERKVVIKIFQVAEQWENEKKARDDQQPAAATWCRRSWRTGRRQKRWRDESLRRRRRISRNCYGRGQPKPVPDLPVERRI